jgi:hypothetical protein
MDAHNNLETLIRHHLEGIDSDADVYISTPDKLGHCHAIVSPSRSLPAIDRRVFSHAISTAETLHRLALAA